MACTELNVCPLIVWTHGMSLQGLQSSLFNEYICMKAEKSDKQNDERVK